MLTFFKLAEVKRDFGRAARSYDDHAGLQREVLARAAATLAQHAPQGMVLDAGCGTGGLMEHKIPGWRVFGVDIAAPMCAKAQARGMNAACADVAHLPLKDASVDALMCSLVLQWVNDRQSAFAEFRRVVRPGGTAAVTLFGPETLKELREVLSRRVSDFKPLAVEELAGWKIVEQSSETYSHYYKSLFELMFSIKAIGAGNKLVNRRRGLTAPETFRRAEELYRRSFGNGGGVCATWQVHTLVLK
jgi:malonyl-CoA O-methyltransferase